MLAWYMRSSPVCVSHSGIVSKQLNVASCKYHPIAQGQFSDAKDHGEIQMGSTKAPNAGAVG